MFEWLEEEIQSVNTPYFHVVDGRLDTNKEKLVRTSPLPVPESYKEFVIKFGNAKLYRQGSTYAVQVYNVPKDESSPHKEWLLNFGRMDDGLAYFKFDLLKNAQESPVFEWTGGSQLRKSADGFEQWLRMKCTAARFKFIRDGKWDDILRGPEPFSKAEREIVEARKKYRWRLLGVDESGDIIFEIYNGSHIRLPYFSVGIRHKDGRHIGGVWLPVQHIGPGETKTVRQNCYKERHNPADIEPYEEPDPDPALRDQYWEFRALE